MASIDKRLMSFDADQRQPCLLFKRFRGGTALLFLDFVHRHARRLGKLGAEIGVGLVEIAHEFDEDFVIFHLLEVSDKFWSI